MNFPNYDVKIKDCTPEMCRTIVALAEKLNIRIESSTKRQPFNSDYPDIYWNCTVPFISQINKSYKMCRVSFQEFVSYIISDPEPEISERDKKLNESVEIIQQELNKIKNLTIL